MFVKRLDEYQRNFLKTRIVSQLPTFLIALVSLLSLYTNLHAAYLFPEYVESNRQYFWIPVAFHILAALFFSSRFVLLFFNSKKSFWLSQLFWLYGLITLFAWCAYTKDSPYGFFYELFQFSYSSAPPSSHSYYTNFRNASYSLDALGSAYFFLSPIRQFIILIHSIIKAKRSRI